ncbi:hypothetical protein V5799_002082 [Amblyomma americanum]|uniref:Uncharacterized protein n=1 Tax=Amblyomma americanum TaxID=6943 RepID=A0AAQ4CYR6_AMBAM
MTAWLFSGDLTLLATIPGSRGVTSPESSTIKEAPHWFVFCGHDGRGLAMTSTRTLFCVLQGNFLIGASAATSAYTCGDRSDIVGGYQLRPDYAVDQMTTLLFSWDLALLATPPGSRGLTSPETTNIQEARLRFVFCGHDGRGLAMTLTRTFFCVLQGILQGIFQIGASTATSAYTCGRSSDIVGVYQLRPDCALDEVTAGLFSGDLALLETPPGSRYVTSPKNTTIKEAPHRFVFCGHDGRGLAMTLTRTLFCVLQGIFQIGASTATSAYTCGVRSDIVGVYQLRPDYTVDQMTAWLFSGDLALLGIPPGSRCVTSPKNTTIKETPHRASSRSAHLQQRAPTRAGVVAISSALINFVRIALLTSRGVTSPETTKIQEAPHRFVFCGHDGRGVAMTPTRTLFCVLQGIFQIGVSTATSAYMCGDRGDIVGVYQLRPDYTVDHMTAWLFSGDLALLETPPGSRYVTSPKNTTIKEAPHRFVFCRHDGRGLAMKPTRTLFCVLQGNFLISASTATSAYTCGDRSYIVGVINFVQFTLLTR